ncbi:hypothetical protein [Candidatus Palauibacter sp.]|uniref:hypothetical protein n=1 Tax=Candidatus Palauibacter sp. TaxID=3101350 RepID=UPI003AF204BF
MNRPLPGGVWEGHEAVRDVFDEEWIRFRVNDPDGALPSPFPVFTSWTRFREDEIFD